jgi:hypothetical protein
MALAGWLFLFSSADLTLKNYGALTLGLGILIFLAWSFRTRQWPFAVAAGKEANRPETTS